MFVFVYVYASVCAACIWVQICMYVWVGLYIYSCLHVYIFACACMCLMPVYISVYILICELMCGFLDCWHVFYERGCSLPPLRNARHCEDPCCESEFMLVHLLKSNILGIHTNCVYLASHIIWIFCFHTSFSLIMC